MDAHEYLIKEYFPEESSSHDIGIHSKTGIDHGSRLGFFPVFRDQIFESDEFRTLPPVFKCCYFLLQSRFSLEGSFYMSDAEISEILGVSHQSRHVGRAIKKFKDLGWVTANRGKLSYGQRLATTYEQVEWTKLPEKGAGKKFAKIDRATFYYLLMKLKDQKKHHDVLITWISIAYYAATKGSNLGTPKSKVVRNRFNISKSDMGAMTNQSKARIERSLNTLMDEGFISGYEGETIFTYTIEDFILLGHSTRFAYTRCYPEDDERWRKLVAPINDFIKGANSKAQQSSDETNESQAQKAIEQNKGTFEHFLSSYKAYYDYEFERKESTQIIQVSTLIKKHGEDQIKKSIDAFFASDQKPKDMSGFYNFLVRELNLKKPKKNTKKAHKSSSNGRYIAVSGGYLDKVTNTFLTKDQVEKAGLSHSPKEEKEITDEDLPF